LYEQARRPVVEGLLNLAESHEIPGSVRSLATYAPELKRKWEGMQKVVGRFPLGKDSNYAVDVINRTRKRFAKTLSKTAASRYLAWSFGIAPLISDAKRLIAYMDKIKADYERFKREQVRTASRVFVGSSSFNKVGATGISYQNYLTTQPTSRYVLKYRIRNPYKTDFVSRLNYLITRFGAGGPASFAWELVPFSFVVDWFLDVSSIASLFDEVLDKDRIETLSLTHSRKYVSISDVFRDVYRTDTNAQVYSGKQASVTHSYYSRQLIGRATYVAPSGRFGKKQASLAVALLLANILK
jgi:hypothetical protein